MILNIKKIFSVNTMSSNQGYEDMTQFKNKFSPLFEQEMLPQIKENIGGGDCNL